MVVNLGGEEGEGRQITHAKVAGVLDDSLFVAVGSLERDVVPKLDFGALIAPCIDSAESNDYRIGHGDARPEVPVVASSKGSPDRFAICHPRASAALSFTSDGTTGLAFLFENCLFSIGWRLLVNEKQTTFKKEKTLWPINQYSHAA